MGPRPRALSAAALALAALPVGRAPQVHRAAQPLPAQVTTADTAGPPNAPAMVETVGDTVTLTYGGKRILWARLQGHARELRVLVDTASDGAITQVLKWTSRDGSRLEFLGSVSASGEFIAGATDPEPNALPVVRNSVGGSFNRLNRAVYDRRNDWVISVDQPAQVRVIAGDSSTIGLFASGFEVAVRFRPRFYQEHRGLRFYRPWTYDVWHESVAGWTSWFAYLDKVTEADIRRTADVLSAALRPYGYEYLQIDDGYERDPIGTPANWLNANDKFPSGLAGLRAYIASRGLRPALWTNVSFQDSTWAWAHQQDFVASPDGGPAHGNWVGYVMDGSRAQALNDLITPVYDSLARMGWTYIKLDALRHLRYEGYNSHASAFHARGLDRAQVFRDVVQAVRDAIGRHTFLLACWGIRPELAGLVDAVRVGTDGFGYGGFAQYNSFNNVVWRNDPDHIQLAAPDGYRAATLASLTGSLLMLTDKPEVYRSPRVEIAKRTAPVLFTQPEQFYDVDPSRSVHLADADVSLSGSGPRPLDADQRLTVPLYLLDISIGRDRWSVLARTSDADSVIQLSALGLDPGVKYTAFEFWSRRYLGVIDTALRPGRVDPRLGVQVFCLKEARAYPWVIATTRHVTGGGPDLQDIQYDAGMLVGTSAVVAGDPYELYVRVPKGYVLRDVQVNGAKYLGTRTHGELRVVRLRADTSGQATWRLRFTEPPRPGARRR
ncbi:MAG TPA: alpha-galactosidase [Gemmatimonadaceae bacterium]|nr:alpha-galactosidase [Gemmatimonadaceae bacterium]